MKREKSRRSKSLNLGAPEVAKKKGIDRKKKEGHGAGGEKLLIF